MKHLLLFVWEHMTEHPYFFILGWSRHKSNIQWTITLTQCTVPVCIAANVNFSWNNKRPVLNPIYWTNSRFYGAILIESWVRLTRFFMWVVENAVGAGEKWRIFVIADKVAVPPRKFSYDNTDVSWLRWPLWFSPTTQSVWYHIISVCFESFYCVDLEVGCIMHDYIILNSFMIFLSALKS